MRRLRHQCKRIAGALILATVSTSGIAAFQDPLVTPATQSAIAAASPLTAIAPAGNRLVAVGQRGHVLVSEDGGKQWIQASVPVSSDLVAVHFPTADKGWAVGHDGVVLHSKDGGRTWLKQWDGREAARTMLEFYQKRAESGDPEAKRALAEAGHFVEQGPVHPFLDVWFENEWDGFVVGAFGLIFATRDGGVSWEPWFDRLDNPNSLHLYGIRGAQDGVYIVGEQGLILRLDQKRQRFVSVPGPYQGSYFGLLLNKEAVIVFGMRGNAFRSIDAGKTWKKVETNVSEGLPGGAVMDDGRLVLVTQGGNLLISRNRGQTFDKWPTARTAAFAGVAAARSGVALVGSQGITLEPLK